jgi:hypothetical protein
VRDVVAFRGSNAAASLEAPKAVNHPTGAEVLPRQLCRGLIEARLDQRPPCLAYEYVPPLLPPRLRQYPGQIFDLHPLRLPAVEDRLDDMRCEQREPQQPIYEACR